MNGAQLERTALAWRRTLVSFTVVSLLLARLAALHPDRLAAVAGVIVVGLLWACAAHVVKLRLRALTSPVRRTLPLAVGLILLYCAMGTLLLVS